MSNRNLKFKKKHTKRGFALWTFEDDNGLKCSLQESILVKPHVWLGSDEANMLIKSTNDLVHLNAGAVIFSRMHINQKQARQLGEALIYFADNGKLKENN